MPFCAITPRQHADFYNMMFNQMSNKKLDVQDFSRTVYKVVKQKTNNEDLALTYASFVPTLGLHIIKNHVTAGANIDQLDRLVQLEKYFENIQNVQTFMNIDPTDIQSDLRPPVEIKDNVSSLMAQAREAYAISMQALEEVRSFEEVAREKGYVDENNKINLVVDERKRQGKVTFTSSNPKELEESTFNLLDPFLPGGARTTERQFIHNWTKAPNKHDFKIRLILENGHIWGLVNFKGKDYKDKKTGQPVKFMLDYDHYRKENLKKPRSVFVAERSSSVKKRFPLGEGAVLIPHNGFFDIKSSPGQAVSEATSMDPIDMLKQLISKQDVIADIEFITQGMLLTPGTTNSLERRDTVDESKRKSIKEYEDEGWTDGSIIIASKETADYDGIFLFPNRVNIELIGSGKNKEIVEFKSAKIKDVTILEDGKPVNILTSDKFKIDIGDKRMSIFEAAILGILPANQAYIDLFNIIFRKSDFLVLNLGESIMLINRKNFSKIINNKQVSTDQIKKLTSLEDLEEAELNIDRKMHSENAENVELGEKYHDFIKRNFYSNTIPTILHDGKQGFTRVNKRIVLTLEKDIDQLKSDFYQTVDIVPNVGEDFNIEDVFKDEVTEDNSTITKPEC